MIKHIAMWRLKPDVEGRSIEQRFAIIKDAMEAQLGAIPGLLESEAGLNFKESEKAFDVAVYTVFESREALEAYHRHPAHQRTRAAVDSLVASSCFVDYEVK